MNNCECNTNKEGSCTTVNHYYGCCGSGSNENIYSEEEIVIGKWIDGKPVYRKVLSGTTAGSEGTGREFANVADLNIQLMIKLYGTLITEADANIPVPLSLAISNNNIHSAINPFYEASTGTIKYHLVGNSYTNRPMFLVMEYTKA